MTFSYSARPSIEDGIAISKTPDRGGQTRVAPTTSGRRQGAACWRLFRDEAMMAATRMRQSGSHRQSGIYRGSGDASYPGNGSIKSDLTPLKANAPEVVLAALLGVVFAITVSRLPGLLALIGLFNYFGRRKAGLVVQRIVNNVPAVLVMADLAGLIVGEDHTPGFTDMLISQRPGARSIGLNLLERVDGAVVPLDSPRDVLTVGAALDEGRDQADGFGICGQIGLPCYANLCSIMAREAVLLE